jgi:hypothetical protein
MAELAAGKILPPGAVHAPGKYGENACHWLAATALQQACCRGQPAIHAATLIVGKEKPAISGHSGNA